MLLEGGRGLGEIPQVEQKRGEGKQKFKRGGKLDQGVGALERRRRAETTL